MKYDGETFEPARDEERLDSQMLRVARVLVDGKWYSLYEIEALTGDSVQSISARIRDLRKERFGCQTIERRNVGGGGRGGNWKYRWTKARVPAKSRAQRINLKAELRGASWVRINPLPTRRTKT